MIARTQAFDLHPAAGARLSDILLSVAATTPHRRLEPRVTTQIPTKVVVLNSNGQKRQMMHSAIKTDDEK